ncbi:Bax inhibitor-1/YccA family protein [Tautonia plasticadhaerens]|uniref:Bax inhibitor 1 like protein n=1 Tax=Tautonia plasticadhaerens TaxID=2527974 RepID=A0A518GVP5_9BACT|nr:Bax inhibitor-1/YccA family protein [Tautonia plasticadhaerens]QDV32670.1 Bax inhibitor 1 like protein [Tautonia plasticadhaerens]
METSNPVFSDTIFNDWAREATRTNTMTVRGTASKCFLALAILTAAAAWVWGLGEKGGLQAVQMWTIGGAIVGLVLALLTAFVTKLAPYTTPVYAAAEGAFLGGISFWFNTMYPGIAFNAMALTFAVLFVMLALYTSRIIPVTEKLRMGIVAATGAVFLVYMLSFVLSFFGISMPLVHDASPWGIGFSVVVVGIAAFNLLLDFDFIERGSQAGAPKAMEWYGAFGLLVTLVWLYISILRLLAQLQSRD